MLALTLALSILIGISLGLLGGGGSILTVPILSYVAGMPPKAAIVSSLVVVAITSAVGVIPHARAGRVMWRTGVWFGGAGMVGAFVGGRVSMLFSACALMIAFGVMMVVTAVEMLRRVSQRPQPRVACETKLVPALVQGFVIGTVTGLLGVGGGF
ncbi:MAG: sulfite exporter TauE/SafE family protein, partial [Deltaproteobacteria bacterium]|nr:sulfite exporter TauE/SafE family protein [Deltaproteobacteria bacterium]